MNDNEESITAQAEAQTDAPPTDDLAAVRDVVLRAHPDAVPELIAGTTIAEMLASVEPARAAYARVVASPQARDTPGDERPGTPHVPAGDAPAFLIDPDQLPPVEKIRRGLAQR